jgi:hypothetical protein
MTQQTINVGASPNDGTGDPWRDAFIKVNANETELYDATLAAAQIAPLMDGIAAPGNAPVMAREDHVHPTDTSRMANTSGAIVAALGFTPGAGTVTSISVVGTSGLTGSGTVTTSGTIDLSLDTTHANDWSGTQDFAGSSTALAMLVNNIAEPTQIIAAAPAATQTIYLSGGSVAYFTSGAANNWTLNVSWAPGVTLDSVMSIGNTIGLTVKTTQGATAYYTTATQIDGTAVTPKWQGGSAPTAGNASGEDVYFYAVTKTAAGAFDVLAGLTQYK